METKDYLIIGLGIIGWTWGIVQFLLNRKYQKADKAIEKRFEVYSNFMNQMDEISLNTRTDPKMIYGIPNEFMSIALTGDEDKINEALIKLNADLLETTKKSLQPTIIINQELNKLKLIASKNLLPKINEYKVLISDFTNEFQSVLNNISTIDDWEKNAIKMQSMGQNERALRMKELWSDIENLMRDEIDYYKK
ncbi:MAG: hypothetical protein CMD31_11815 [Flavobacteriales bacterium]|jgi:hypothetical protein|nr:hypothetical protein [Flavobacteriales bacterium]MBL1233889.1 hypothetical protein [Flavobacteriales bacterium]MBQ21434.1 hypothetical protein [Flavobacteriales bacterium]|tara:strand:+ start:124560 stop:125141 length:582 start_codon:yes stop_codon:yes gene_type:complete